MSNVVNFQDYKAKAPQSRQYDDPYLDALICHLTERQRRDDETISDMVARMMLESRGKNQP